VKKLDGGDEEARRILYNALGRDEKEGIEAVFKLYRAPRIDDNAVTLGSELEAFKGFGLYADKRLADDISGPETFINHSPKKSLSVSRHSDNLEYLDFKFPTDDSDVVVRFKRKRTEVLEISEPPDGALDDIEEESRIESAEHLEEEYEETAEVPSTGSIVIIEQIMELLTRSFKADEMNGIYYISIITTIVRSSHFGDMEYFARSKKMAQADRILAAGWQKVPPIFQMILARRPRMMLKRISGFDLVLGALIDEIISGLTGQRSSARTEGNGERKPQWKRETLARAVYDLETAYGENMLRKLLRCPPNVLRDDRKREILNILSEKK